MKSAVTVSLVPEARGGPFVLWDDLAAACKTAHEIGYDAIELFAPSADAVDVKELRRLLDGEGLKLAAVGTGAGWVKHRLHLALPDAAQRQKARDFIRSIIHFGAEFAAPAIIGSMQGRSGDGVSQDEAKAALSDALHELSDDAKQHGVPLIYEPLNRYETDQFNRATDAANWLDALRLDNVVLLCDFFHMNIEEVDVAVALRIARKRVGHVHFVDSNRRPVGHGHLDVAPCIAALREIGYDGYLSAEAFPYPDPISAARQTMNAFRYHVGTRS
jgi:sugar phosphate isomerase/epimerase